MDPAHRRILIVDDDPDMRVFLTNLLAEGGFVPAPAENPADVLQMARTVLPVLIILGVPIHRSGGADLYRQLRTDPALGPIPVMLLSTIPRKSYLHYQRMQETRQGQALPEPDDFLLKPPEAEELLRRVQRLTQTRANGKPVAGDRRADARSRRALPRPAPDIRAMPKPPQSGFSPGG